MKTYNDLPKKARIERFENVIRVLRALPAHEKKKHFNMSNYGITTDCGTAACAAGYASMDSWFRRRGLKGKYIFNMNSLVYIGGVVPRKIMSINDKTNGSIGPQVESFFGYEGSRIFFDTQPRSVAKVVGELRAHIKRIEKSENLI